MFHSQELAMAMIVEAGTGRTFVADRGAECLTWEAEQAAQELADGSHLVRLADRLDIDLMDAAQRKLVINAHKYPADKVRGSAKKAGEP
jgi:hypothetical protein